MGNQPVRGSAVRCLRVTEKRTTDNNHADMKVMGHLSSALKIEHTFCKLGRSMTNVQRGCTPLKSNNFGH